MSAFQSQYAILEKEVRLQFDGEDLDIESTVAQTEIGNMDNIDVYVK